MLFASLKSFVKYPIVLTIPNLFSLFDNHFSCFSSRINLFSSSKVDSKSFFSMFVYLMLIRLQPHTEKGKRFISLANSFRYPRGFQNAVKLIPLGGYFFSVRGVQISVVLDDSYFQDVLSDMKENELLSSLSFLSKELNNGRNTLHECFDDVGMLSRSQNFMFSSFFVKETGLSVLHINDLHPSMTMGSAFSFIFKMRVDESGVPSLSLLSGCIASISLDDQHLYANEREAIEIIFHFKVNKKVSSESSNRFQKPSDTTDHDSINLNRHDQKIFGPKSIPKKGISSDDMSLMSIVSIVVKIVKELTSNEISVLKRKEHKGLSFAT